MKIFGFDLASRKLAGIQLYGDDAVKYTFKPPLKMKDRSEVLAYFRNKLVSFFPDDDFYVFIEAPLVGRAGVHATIVQAQVQGLVLAESAYYGSKGTYSVNVKTWKKAVVGNGNADKADVTKWLAAHHPLLHKLADGDQDLVDAACIAIYGRDIVTRGNQLKQSLLVDP